MFQRVKRKTLTALSLVALTASSLSLAGSASAAEGDVSRAVGFNINVGKTVGARYVGVWGIENPSCAPKNCAAVALDPGKTVATTYDLDKVEYTGDMGGKYAGPNARQTSRIAYLMGKHGTTSNAIQAAALDSAVLTILNPKSPWAYNRSMGEKRLRATKQASKIKPVVQSMLKSSLEQSGPYTFKVNATGEGSDLNISVVAKTLAGNPVVNRSVGLLVNGVDSYTLTTNGQGKASLSLSNQTPGTKTVQATLRDVLDWRTFTSTPQASTKTRMVIAGTRVSIVRNASTSVKGNQSLTINGPASVMVPDTIAGSVAIAGQGGDRAMVTRLYGPYPTSQAATDANCTGTPAYAANSVVNANGSYPLVSGASSAGFWRYYVSVDGNASNNPASTCGPIFAAKSQVTLTVKRERLNEAANGSVKALVTIAGLPNADSRTVTVKLYGPFNGQAGVSCNESKLLRTVTLSVNGDGTYTGPSVLAGSAGWYGWRANVDGSALSTPAGTGCPPTGTATFLAE